LGQNSGSGAVVRRSLSNAPCRSICIWYRTCAYVDSASFFETIRTLFWSFWRAGEAKIRALELHKQKLGLRKNMRFLASHKVWGNTSFVSNSDYENAPHPGAGWSTGGRGCSS
jgi:hypothetical protein